MMINSAKNSAKSARLAPLFMITGMLLAPIMDGTAKLLVEDYSFSQVVWGRYFFHLLSLLPLFLLFGERPTFARAHIKWQTIRALFLLGDTALFFAALAFIPLANGTAVFFVAPLIMTALAPLVLSEKVGWHRWAPVLVGFSGTLLILQPEADGEWFGYLLAFGAAAFYAIYLLLTRKLAATSSPLNTLLYTAIIGTLIMSIVVPFEWTTPDLRGWLLMLATGVIGTLSHFFIIKAFEGGDASHLAPFTYSEIISATLFGVIVFGQFPGISTWIGISIVMASGLYIFKREQTQPNS
ncbi:MAG: DMT family transporter [Sneathiella sp.]